MNNEFDLIVIGTGSAGKSAVYPLASAGWKVAIVDERPFGGTCMLRGCDPKKILVGAAEAVDWHQRLSERGVLKGQAAIDWGKLIAFKKASIKGKPKNVEKELKEAGIDTFHGTAEFLDEESVNVNGQTLRGKYFLVATGASPVKLGIVGEERVTVSDDFLEIESLPKKIIFIGGGYISFEFAHIAKRAGSDVEILHRSDRPLGAFDLELVTKLVAFSKEIGIKVHLNTEVIGVSKRDSSFSVLAKQSGKEMNLKADLVVHGGGRAPNLEKLNLDRANIEVSDKGVKVNQFLQSVSNHKVYAAGDAADSGPPLTPIAGTEGSIVAHNLLNSSKRKALFKAVPSVVFTVPPLASVGLTEEQAKQSGLDYEVKYEDTSDWYSSTRINEHSSAYKTLVEKKTGRILGAHLFGHGSDEVINIFAVAITHNITADDLKEVIYSYPSRSSDIEYMV